MLNLASYQIFSQVVKQYKSNPFPFDSGASIHIETYRLIRSKTIKCDTLISYKNKIIYNDSLMLLQCNNLNNVLQSTILKHQNRINHLERFNSDLANQNEGLLNKMDDLEPKKKWYERKETFIGAGVGLLVSLIVK